MSFAYFRRFAISDRPVDVDVMSQFIGQQLVFIGLINDESATWCIEWNVKKICKLIELHHWDETLFRLREIVEYDDIDDSNHQIIYITMININEVISSDFHLYCFLEKWQAIVMDEYSLFD